MNPELAISLQNITKSYRLYDKPIDRLKESLNPFKKTYHQEFFALKNINLDIKKGEVLGIVGINGAGKSTLLKIIAGVVTPSGGNLQVNGRVNAILELGSALKPEMTGIENIKLNLKINGVTKNTQQLLDEIVDFADIGEHINQPVKSYSSGMTARLGFAIATSTDPDILIVDEVLAVGDVLFQRKCYAKIEQLFKDGKTVIFVSHSAQSVIEFCTRAVLLYDREIILDDTPKKIVDYYQKLLFSNNKKEVITEIKQIVFLEDSLVSEPEEENHNKQDTNINYLPELKSDPIEYRNADVDIYDVVVLDANNNKVNLLQTGKEYTYQYKVRFNQDFTNVAFGLKLKTKEGFELSSLSTYLNRNKLINVSKGVYIVSNKFKCNLLDGYYFFNAGVSIHEPSKDMSFLNRLIDAQIVKVENPQENSILRGVIEQNNIFKVERYER